VDDWITITGKFANKCIVCGVRIEAGEQVHWKKGTGIKHIHDCDECEALLPPSEDIIIIEETKEEWRDMQKYSHEKLQTLTDCQRCGRRLDKTKDSFINLDRKTCQGCFFK
jgi:hypothetical protein